MNKDYKYVINNVNDKNTLKEKILFILNYLSTHNKNLTKTQEWLIGDLITLIEGELK